MSIEKYGHYWAVYDTCGVLICLTVYKKGALEVVRRLQDACPLRDPARRSLPCPQSPERSAPRGCRQP